MNNLRSKWMLPEDALPSGVVLHAGAFDSERQIGDRLDAVPLVLIDPDVYLWGLDYQDCGKSCRYLATYPWVPIDVPTLAEAAAETRSAWVNGLDGIVAESWPPQVPDTDDGLDAIVDRCVRWQLERGVARVILPATLVSALGDIDVYVRWVDAGIRTHRAHGAPSLMSVPISARAAPKVVETLLDVLTSRLGSVGAYVCVESSTTSRYITEHGALLALLDLSYHLGHRMHVEVVVNFADLFGLACRGVGASHFVTGYSAKDRQLALSDFSEAGGGGGAYPRLLSLSACCRFRTGQDMNAIRDARLLTRVLSDSTSASTPLFEALAAGHSAADVLPWAENLNNEEQARAHMNQLLSRDDKELSALETIEDRVAWVFSWLQSAELLCSYLQRRFAEAPLDEMGQWTSAWRAAVEQFAGAYGLL